MAVFLAEKDKKYFKKPSRFLFFRHIKYVRIENGAEQRHIWHI